MERDSFTLKVFQNWRWMSPLVVKRKGRIGPICLQWKKWNENCGEIADTFILQRMTLSGRSLVKHVQTWKHDSVVQHTQGKLAIVCMDKHFVRNVVSVIKSTIVWNGYKTERGLQNNYHN